jgi:hypothetical protein
LITEYEQNEKKKGKAPFCPFLFLPISLPNEKEDNLSLPQHHGLFLSLTKSKRPLSLSLSLSDHIKESLAASPNKSTKINIFLSDKNYKTPFSPLRPDLTYVKEKVWRRSYMMANDTSLTYL